MDPLGHLAFALVLVAPAWFRWDGRVSLAFVGYGLLTALAPDVDRILPGVATHGPTHSLTFVAVVALVAGALIAVAAEPVLTRWWVEDERCLPDRETIYAFTTAGLLLGGLSHLVADLLFSAPPARPLEPLWPFLGASIPLHGVRPFTEPGWDLGLLVLALTAHVGLFFVDRR